MLPVSMRTLTPMSFRTLSPPIYAMPRSSGRLETSLPSQWNCSSGMMMIHR